jgi:hypothetical protein
MIFLSSFVELLVVDAHQPTGDSPLRNEFIFLIADNRHSTLLQHHLYWTCPFTVRNRIDNSSLKWFQHLLLYYLPHCIIQSPLMLTDRLMILLLGNAMSAKARTNSLQILERIANDHPILLLCSN